MKRELMDWMTAPAWLCIFMFLGACLGVFAWALDWGIQFVRSFL